VNEMDAANFFRKYFEKWQNVLKQKIITFLFPSFFLSSLVLSRREFAKTTLKDSPISIEFIMTRKNNSKSWSI
jgi:hypothetical protein